MATLTGQFIVTEQKPPSKEGGSAYMTVLDIEAGERLGISIPVLLDARNLGIILNLAFAGVSAHVSKAGGLYYRASGVSLVPDKAEKTK